MAASNALASLALDRFVSASSAEDAHSSLERILEALKNNKLKGEVAEDTPVLSPEMIWSDQDILNSLRYVLQTGKHKNQEMEVPVDEGASLVCKIYMEMVEQESTKSPLLEKDEALLESLIDVISSTDNNNEDDGVIVSMYTRVLALQFLTKLCVKRPSLAQAQLLQAPNGLHRLGDLLQIHTEEIIRNEALLLAQVIADWPSCAKIWMFAEVADQVILLAVEEGGLTGGSLLVQDCLDLLFKLWKHDPNLADLVFQSPTITDNLPRLLDLRKGTEFLNPPKKGPVAKKDDDLDDILKSASAKEAESKDDGVVVPKLTAAEEKVIEKTLDILALLLESDSLKQAVWNREKNLCSLLWELSLVSPPPPQVPYVCAVPSPQLQQKALETVSLYFHDPNTMERHAGLDRLLYLVCTGGLGGTLEEKMGISQGALHVIRRTVSLESANQMLMYTLAPPMSMDGEGNQPPPTVVHKLLNTVAENLTPTPGIDMDRRKIFLAGALGGLSIFLTDQTSREVMLRLTTTTSRAGPSPEDDPANEDDDDGDNATTITSSLIESILHAVGAMEEAQNPEDAFFSMTLLRFLCHWTVETPAVVQTILSSNQSSIVLSALLGIKVKSQSHKKGVAVLGKLLLGLAMEYMGDDEEKCGGWTRASIMELISKKGGGVSKFTSTLEQFKSVHDFGSNMPWSVCELEYKVWSQWFANCVLLVRKRVVQELTGSGEGEDEDDDDDEGLMAAGDNSQVPVGSGSARSLQKLVYQQSQEIDELQQSLQKANNQIQSQEHEISEYKRRVESAPSQLDNMLDEYSAKISELEASIASEVEEKKSLVEKQQAELQSRDEQIAALEKELEESRAREKEARDETETLREEIESLSQAYTGLEQEYRQQQQQSGGTLSAETTTTTSEQQPGEQEQEGSQQHRPQEQQPSSSTGAGSTEISALRSENERLRSDAQAADQWMAMAVEKMRVLGQQNAGLQAELSHLRDGQSQSDLQMQYNTLYGENQSLHHQLGQLQAHLGGLEKENHELKLALQQEQEHRIHLDQQLSGATQELQSTQKALEETNSQASAARSEFESRLESMAGELEHATAEANRLTEQLNLQQQINTDGESQASRYALELSAKDDELERLKAELEGQSTNANALRTEVAQLSDQLKQLQEGAAQGESEALAQATANFEATLASKNVELDGLNAALEEQRAELSHLREQLSQQKNHLEARPNAFDETASAAKQEDVESLRLALETKTSEAQSQMQAHANEVEAFNHAMGKLQQDIEAAKVELESVRRHEQEEIYQRESRIRELEARLTNGTGQAGDELKQRDAEIAELKAANEAAQEWMARAVEHHNMLSEQHGTMASEKASLASQVRALQEQVTSNEAVVAQARMKEEEALRQSGRLKEAEASLVSCKGELARVQNELAHLQSQCGDLALVTAEAENLRAQVGTLNSSILEQTSSFEELKEELSSEMASKATMQEEVAALKTKLDEASGIEDLRGEVAMLQERTQTLESALNEKTAAHEQLNIDISVEREAKTTALNDVEALKERAAQLASEVETLRATTESLGEESQKVTELFNQLQRVKEENADLLRTQKDDKGAITRLNDEIAALRSTAAASSAQPTTATSAENFFAGGSSTAAAGKGSAPAPQSAQDLFSAPAPGLGNGGGAQEFFGAASPGESTQPQTSGIGGAQEVFSAAAPSTDGAHGFFAAGQSTADEGNSVGGAGGATRQVEELENQLQKSRLELENTKRSLAENEAKLRERVSELETTVNKLQGELDHERKEKAMKQPPHTKSLDQFLEEKNAEQAQPVDSLASVNAIAGTTSDQLQRELDATKAKLNEALSRLEDDDNVVAKWEERVAELESIVKDLEEQLAEQEESANAVIEQWQESCNSLEAKNKELLQSLESSTAATREGSNGEANDTILALRAELDIAKAELAATQGAKEVSNGQENGSGPLLAELEQTKAALAAAQAKIEEDDSVVVKWEERVAGLESAIKDMEFQLREQEENASTVIAKWQESCNALEEKNAELLSSLESSGPGELISKDGLMALQERLREAETELAKAKDNLKDDDDVVLRWQERVAELESASKVFVDLMEQQEEEAKTAIAKWQESCSALEDRSQHLSEELEAAHEKEHELGAQLQQRQKALDEAKASLREDEISLAKWQERVSELEEIVKDLQAQLRQQEEEAENAIGQWQENCNALQQENTQLSQQLAASNENESTLQAKLKETQKALDEAKHKLKDDQESLAKGQERVSELEGAVKDLEVQLSDQEEETKSVIVKWQGSCTALEEQNKRLNELLKASTEDTETLGSQLKVAQERLAETEQRIKDDEDVVAQWQERVSELEGTINELQAQLNEQEEEAEAAIAKWQESCSSLEGQRSELAQKLESTSEMESSMKRQIEETQNALEEAKDNLKSDEDAVVKWQERVAELETIVKDLEQQLSEQEEEASNAIEMWQQNCNKLEERNAELVECTERIEEAKQEAISAIQQQLDETQTALAATNEKVAFADENATKVQEQLGLLTADKQGAEAAAAQLREQLTSLEEKNSNLGNNLRDANQKLEAANKVGNDNQEALKSLQSELEDAKRRLSDATGRAGEDEQKHQEQVAELEKTITELEEQMTTEEEEAKHVIQEWERSYQALQAQNTELEESLEQANTAQHTLQAELEESKQALSETRLKLDEGNSDGIVADLEAKIGELEQQLDASEEEASTVIAQWQDTVKSLEASKKELTDKLAKATDEQQTMQGRLTTLQEKLKETEAAAAAAQASSKEGESSVGQLRNTLKEKENELRLTQEKLESLQGQLQEKEASLEDLSERADEDEQVVKEWEQRTHELEATITELKAELEEQEKEASNAISQWEERYTQLEKEKTELTQSLEASLKRGKELADENDSLESSSQAQMTESMDALTAEKARANDLKEQLAELESMVNLLQQRLLDSEKGSTALREQISELESMVNLMQQRLLDSGKEASAARTSLQEATSQYESKNSELTAKLTEAQAKIELLESTAQSAGDATELEAKLTSLEEAMKGKDKEMADAVAEWQQHCVDLESRNTELSNKLEAINKDPDFEGSPEEHIAELEAQVKSLEEEIEEATGIVENWQESYSVLETRNGELESELAARVQEIQSLEATRSRELESNLASRVQEIQSNNAATSSDTDETKVELRDLKSKLAASEGALSSLQQELESLRAAKEGELSELSKELEEARKERDDALPSVNLTEDEDGWSMQDIPVDADMTQDNSSRQNDTNTLAVQELSTKIQELEGQVQALKNERDALLKEFEDSKTESAEIVGQWAESNKQLEAKVADLEEQLEEQHDEAAAAIGSWESRCRELQESLNESQSKLDSSKADLVALLKAQLESQDRLLVSHSDSYESDPAVHADAEIGVDEMRAKVAEKQALLGDLVSKQESDINTLFTEMEQMKSTNQESQTVLENSTISGLNAQMEDLMKEIAEKEGTIEQLQNSLAENQASQMNSNGESIVGELEAKIVALEQRIEEETVMRQAVEEELSEKRDKLSKFVLLESQAEAELDNVRDESKKLRQSQILVKSQLEEATKSESLIKVELEDAKYENETLRESESQAKSELAEAKAELERLRESISKEKDTDGEQLQETIDALQSEKTMLEQELERLSRQTTELQDELVDANNAVQVYVAKEVSDRATAMAAHALREQLHEIRKQADSDRAAFAAEKEARIAAEGEVERLRTDLFALVDISDQENEMYGVAALTIKAADKIHRKERSEITELRTSLTRALEELRASRLAEKDAEERAAKASHHIVVCEQELAAAKSDMRYLIQTMDEMRQDEASRRASLEHRIRTLENDHDVLRRFHSSETDSLRSELTQAVLERDRTLQLLKDSEKNNAAMIYAASKDHTASTEESREQELAKLRIEKAQLLVASAEEGERTERRLREVIATEVSSAEADVLVERERRLAAEAACENMKLLVVELQKDVQAYKEDTTLGSYSPRRAKMEQDNERLRQEISRLTEESANLRSKLEASESAHENANYRIEKLEAECRLAQASSNRLDREIRFQSEVQMELHRMRSSPVVKPPPPILEDHAGSEKKEDDLRTVELYDKIHEQAEAMQRAREIHQALQVEHEDLLALLAQQEEVKKSLETALARAGGQAAVDEAIREAEESSIAQYGLCVRVSTP